MTLSAILTAFLVFQSAPPQDASQPTKPSVNETSDEKSDAQNLVALPAMAAPTRSAKITDKEHPEFVRCKSESVIGSRAKRKRTCMTNREWALVQRRGNEQTEEFMGDNFAAGLN